MYRFTVDYTDEILGYELWSLRETVIQIADSDSIYTDPRSGSYIEMTLAIL